MIAARALGRLAIALVAGLLAFPVACFEAVYQVNLPLGPLRRLHPAAPPPSLVTQALWITTGEALGAGITPQWLGNSFPEPSQRGSGGHGQIAAQVVAHALLDEEDRCGRSTLTRLLRRGALTVWLTRHRSEAELQHDLAQWTDFGRNVRGVTNAAAVFYGLPVEALSVAQVAELVTASNRHDRANPLSARKRRAYVLAALRDAGLISATEHLHADREPLGASPSTTGPEPEERPSPPHHCGGAVFHGSGPGSPPAAATINR